MSSTIQIVAGNRNIARDWQGEKEQSRRSRTIFKRSSCKQQAAGGVD